VKISIFFRPPNIALIFTQKKRKKKKEKRKKKLHIIKN
jgi:hypothetical protein